MLDTTLQRILELIVSLRIIRIKLIIILNIQSQLSSLLILISHIATMARGHK